MGAGSRLCRWNALVFEKREDMMDSLRIKRSANQIFAEIIKGQEKIKYSINSLANFASQ
jgi:hypothetical protein